LKVYREQAQVRSVFYRSYVIYLIKANQRFYQSFLLCLYYQY